MTEALSIKTGATLVPRIIGAPYQQILEASGGTPPYNWMASTALPPGLNLDFTGTLSGTPTATGQYAFAIQVSDSNLSTAQQNFSLTISALGGEAK